MLAGILGRKKARCKEVRELLTIWRRPGGRVDGTARRASTEKQDDLTLAHVVEQDRRYVHLQL